MARTAIPLYVTNQVITAAHMNTCVRDNEAAHWPYTNAGDLAYASAADTLSRLAAVNGGILQSGAAAPSWLPAGTASSIMHNNGASNPAWLGAGANGTILGLTAGVLTWLAAGGDGSVMYNNGASAPAWLPAGTGSSIMYNNGASNPAWLGAGANGGLLGMTGGAPSWLAAGLASSILYNNGASNPAWLGAGANGGLLGMAGGVPVWSAAGGSGQVMRSAGATSGWGSPLADVGIDNGPATWTSTNVAAWQDVGATLTLTLPAHATIIAIATGTFESSGGWFSFMSVNIDGTNGQTIETVTSSCGTPVFAKTCAAGNVICKLQAYAYSTDTCKVDDSQIIAFAFAS